MRELPILFQTEMVQANLDGRKDMTRRTRGLSKVNKTPNEWEVKYMGGDLFCFFAKDGSRRIEVKSPYGKAGDVLWVREAFRYSNTPNPEVLNYEYKDGTKGVCVPDGEEYKISDYDKLRPSIHMPKEAARIWLKVLSVKAERAQDISEDDALREGIMQCTKDGNLYKYGLDSWEWQDWHKTAKEAFKHLWVSINGQESWDANPWVWVVEYKILSTTGKPSERITNDIDFETGNG
jgi:hypothetical protein